MSKVSKQIQKKRDNVKNKISKEPKVYWFMICEEGAKALVKGETEEDTKKELKKLVKKSKYEGVVIWRIKVKYHSKVVSGSVSIAINNWTVEDGKLKRKPIDGKVGLVSVDARHLDEFGWKKRYIKSIINGLTIHNKKLNSVMPTPYFEYEDY